MTSARPSAAELLPPATPLSLSLSATLTSQPQQAACYGARRRGVAPVGARLPAQQAHPQLHPKVQPSKASDEHSLPPNRAQRLAQLRLLLPLLHQLRGFVAWVFGWWWRW